MKRLIAVLLALFVFAGVFTLSGCKREREADLSDGMHLTYDKKISTLEGNTVENKEGHWRIVIHPCTTRSDLTSRRSYFENTLTSIVNTDVVNEDKTFGDLTFRTEYHTSAGKFAGSYFTEFKSPIKTNNILHPLYGIYCYVSAEDNSYVDEIESIMQGLSVEDVVK